MPHINRIRVNNVKYNFGTQFYDDFLMRFSCKNTIYDLANGGGKSVLMLLLLQNLIPNCSLDDKQPIEKLFRTNEGSTTIHSMIEWSLSDVHIKDNFRYMLTGFCARKAKDSGEENESDRKNGTSIEYFNYCIFYRNFNDHDIKNFPLAKDGERVTYQGLKNYLRELQKRDMSLEVKIFERKGDYQRFIAEYGLYESEWEIIRGINKTEGHVRTYFETNYKTTRKVVEDLLIEEIIEKSFKNRYADNDKDGSLAETLLNIKDKLIELSKKKDEINNYDRQIEIIEGFAERVNTIKQLYSGIEDAFTNLKKSLNTLEALEDKNKKDLEKNIEVRAEIKKDKDMLEQKVETARILVDMKTLSELEERLQAENMQFEVIEEEITDFNERLNLLEGGNYYLEYVQCKKEYEKLKQVMDNILKGNDTLLHELKELLAIKKIFDGEKLAELQKKVQAEKEVDDKESMAISELEDEIKKKASLITVLDYQLAEKQKHLEKVNAEMIEEKNNAGILLPAEAKNRLREIKLQEEELNKEAAEIEAELERLSDVILNLKIEIQDEKHQIQHKEEKKLSIQNNVAKLLSVHDKLNKIKQVYQESDLNKLAENIEKTYRNMILAVETASKQGKDNEQEIKNLELGKAFSETEDILNVLNYVQRYHSTKAISGADYLAKTDEEERRELVNRIPLLPYAIIAFENYEQIIMDSRISGLIKTGQILPVINGENIHKIDKNDIEAFAFLTVALVDFSKGGINKKREKLNNDKLELERVLRRKCENEQVVKEDFLFVRSVMDNYFASEDINPDEAIENLSNEIDEHTKKQVDLMRRLDETREAERNLKENQVKNHIAQEDIRKAIISLQRLVELVDDFHETEIFIRDKKEIKARGEKENNDLLKRLEAHKNVREQSNFRMASLIEELEGKKQFWSGVVAGYFDESVYSEVKNSQEKQMMYSYDELEIKIQAAFEAIRKENNSVADKEKLLENYQTNMERSLSHIDYMGMDIIIFENMYRNNELIHSTSKELSEIKKHQSDLRNREKQKRKTIQEIRTEKDILKGKINHSVALLKNKYGSFDENLVKQEEVKIFLEENGRILHELDGRLEEINRCIKDIEGKQISVTSLRRDVTRLMTKSGIKQDVCVGVFETGVQLEKVCQETSEKLDKFIEEKFKKGEQFLKELSLLCETLKKLGAQDLASEFRLNINMPADLEETSELIKMLKETNELIELEKQRVIKGLSDIQIIKENFEKQCIQSCINIKTELDRLSKLSKINIDNENISVINLKIPYIKEEMYEDRMSEYIDRLVKATDNIETEEERLKYIKNNLSWKKMFSVIVADMNAIKLNIYKRERIADQSRFLPYEEAVGSTGQSQGIYIQFLISIINYISSINSKNADASRLKKVIFIDNPFGAAKDVYIWEPIFKLLKTNNVQLVVPARGATPAITGKFDVNYVLGQKICDGKQQTVVVDYFSNVNNDEMEYTALEYEQTRLF